MQHNIIIAAILGTLFYIMAPEYFWYVLIALALWVGYAVLAVLWDTTKDPLWDTPDGTEDKDDD